MTLQRYHLGCPIWSNRHWSGTFFSADARSNDYLRQYSSVFNTVEGNTTFYGTPKPDTVARWREDAAPGFHFCFKFPRTISHDHRLHRVESETKAFLNLLAPLGDKLGPLFLQLPPTFGPRDLPALRDYLATLPSDFAYAVEVRHLDFFDKGEAEKILNRLLREHAMDRVMLDSRPLFNASADDEDTRGAQRKKPRLPVHVTAVGPRPLVRFIGHPDVLANRPFLDQWVAKVAQWIGEGLRPYVFMHTPNNHRAPELARLFHAILRQQNNGVGALPQWPVEEVAGTEQLGLF